jgi:transposase
MPGSKPTILERHTIYQTYLILKSYRAVSRALGWSDKTVKLVVERWKENPFQAKLGGGRKKSQESSAEEDQERLPSTPIGESFAT